MGFCESDDTINTCGTPLTVYCPHISTSHGMNPLPATDGCTAISRCPFSYRLELPLLTVGFYIL